MPRHWRPCGGSNTSSSWSALRRMTYCRLFFRLWTEIRSERFPDVQFFDLPVYLRAADLACLLQDPDHVTSLYQSPAKLIDALAMELPVLATPVPPLERMIAEGLIDAVGDEPLGPRIAAIFDELERYREKARRNRECFIREYSYSAKRAFLRETVERHLDRPKPQPEEFGRLLEFHRNEFGGGERGASLPIRVLRPGASEGPDASGKEADGFSVRPCREGTQVDVVVFWKQNDSGMYGRRHDMLVKYMSKLPRVRRVLLVDAPIDLGRLARMGPSGSDCGREEPQPTARLVDLEACDGVGEHGCGEERCLPVPYETQRYLVGCGYGFRQRASISIT